MRDVLGWFYSYYGSGKLKASSGCASAAGVFAGYPRSNAGSCAREPAKGSLDMGNRRCKERGTAPWEGTKGTRGMYLVNISREREVSFGGRLVAGGTTKRYVPRYLARWESCQRRGMTELWSGITEESLEGSSTCIGARGKCSRSR